MRCTAPRYPIFDPDTVFSNSVVDTVKTLGVEPKPTRLRKVRGGAVLVSARLAAGEPIYSISSSFGTSGI
jgi:hypothetical protein